ncbi:MAG: hypothetical protein KME46_23970 [Brasilonema angustatum HA4187-MV1]|nr:hypothetical protein [Brasilonema angustatum HA4187-MV1]
MQVRQNPFKAIALLCPEGFFQNPSPQISDLGQPNSVWLGHRARQGRSQQTQLQKNTTGAILPSRFNDF